MIFLVFTFEEFQANQTKCISLIAKVIQYCFQLLPPSLRGTQGLSGCGYRGADNRLRYRCVCENFITLKANSENHRRQLLQMTKLCSIFLWKCGRAYILRLPPPKKNHMSKAGINLGTFNMHEWYLSSEQFFFSNVLCNRN